MLKLPSSIQYIKPGEYTFKIQKVNEKRGAVVRFKEQFEAAKGKALENIEEDGLGEDQLRKFINNGVIARYYNYLRSLPGEKLVEEFLGGFNIGGDQINSIDDLAELGEFGDENKARGSKGRGKEKLKEKYQQSIEEQRDKLKAVMDRWVKSPTLLKHFMKMTEVDGSNIARAISSKFPRSIVDETGAPTFASIIHTQPVVEMVLKNIMSPHMPLPGGGKSIPWIHFVWDDFKKMALKEPLVRASMEKMIRYKRKDKQLSMPVTDSEISSMVNSQSNALVSTVFQRLRDKIGETITVMKGDPALKKFFERREVFQSYIQKQLEPAIEQYIKEKGLSLPDDMDKIEEFKNKYIARTIKKMLGPGVRSASEKSLIRQLMVHMSSSVV